MQSIKLKFIKELKINFHLLENKYSYIQNFFDILNIINNLYYFLINPFFNFKIKILYIFFYFEKFFSKILYIIQYINYKNKSSITASFMKLWNKKKKWVQIDIITSIPLSNSMEEYLLKFFNKSYNHIKFFMEKKVNNRIIGGLKLSIEDKELDSSLEENIKKLNNTLKIYI